MIAWTLVASLSYSLVQHSQPYLADWYLQPRSNSEFRKLSETENPDSETLLCDAGALAKGGPCSCEGAPGFDTSTRKDPFCHEGMCLAKLDENGQCSTNEEGQHKDLDDGSYCYGKERHTLCTEWANFNDTWAHVFAFIMAWLVFIVIGVVTWWIAEVVYACMYKSKVTDQRPKGEYQGGIDNGGEFERGLCDCFSDCDVCMHGWCCPWCTAGDTYEGSDTMGYWTVIGIFLVAQVASSLASGGIYNLAVSQGATPEEAHNYSNLGGFVCCLIVGLAFATKRKELREKLGGNDGNFLVDCLIWGFCSECAICQEARSLNAAQQAKVTCCCNLHLGSEGLLVGDAVSSGSE